MNNSKLRWVCYGFLFGLCFPTGALLVDLLINDLPLTFIGIKLAHDNNFLHWIIDSAPFVLAFTGLLIGINREELERKKHDLTQFLNSAPVMMWMTDAHSHEIACNSSWQKFTRNKQDFALSFPWQAHSIHPDDRNDYFALYKWSLLEKKPFQHEFRHIASESDEYCWLRETSTPRFTNNHQYQGHTGVCVDVTRQVEAEQNLFEEKERAQVTLHAIADGVISTDANNAIHFMNPSAEQLCGVFLNDVFGHPLEQVFVLIDQKTRLSIKPPSIRCFEEKQTIKLEENAVLLHTSGQEFSIEGSISPILSRDQKVLGAVLSFTDVTDSRLHTQQLTYQARHDPLTSLFNRNEFERRLTIIFDQTISEKKEHALCYLDLDQFKIVNDTCGHLVGDELLCQITHLIKKRIRENDVFARLGGDEFGIILVNCPAEKAKIITESIRADVENFRFIRKGKTFRIGVSIGLVFFNENDNSITDLLIKADAACYQAKDQGRNRVHVFSTDDEELSQKQGQMEWVSRIHQALEEDLFVLYVQAIKPLSGDNKIYHYEILTRMQNIEDRNKIIPPNAFIPAAERYNIAHLVDRWVIINTLKWVDAHYHQLKHIAGFSINLSAQSLSNETLLSFIVETLSESSIPSSFFCFEITETAAISNIQLAKKFVNQLKKLGCQLALDDFGSGLSSFAYLKNLPVDYLKIDGIFIKNIVNDRTDHAMVSSINNIGHTMGIKTIAEWIDSDEITSTLQEIGIDYGQGYALHNPIPISKLLNN